MTASPPAGRLGERMAAPPFGFLFDPNRCTGCAACALACSVENELGWGRSWRQIVPFNAERRPGVPSFHLSLTCNHCADAPCVTHCPTGAMRRDASTGAVLVDDTRCIGCRYCAWVCPYDAPRFDEERGVMTKCTLCGHRLREGGSPACVEACPTDALGFGPLVGAERIPGFPDTAAAPRIAFTPLRRDGAPPESSWSLPGNVLAAYAPDRVAQGRSDGSAQVTPAATGPVRPPRPWASNAISFRSEAPLWLFTSGLAWLVGWIGAAAWGTVRAPLAGFLVLAGAALAVALPHLGRPLGAWRALANLRASALSREIAGTGAFLAATTLWLAWGGASASPVLPGAPGRVALAVLGGLATMLGLFALTAVDRVYRPVRARPGLDAADTLLTGPLVGAALLRSPWIFGALSALKLTLRIRRGGWQGLAGMVAMALQLAAFAGPIALWTLSPAAWPGWALLLVAGSDLVDRARLYRELTIPGPRLSAREETVGWVSRPRRRPDPRMAA